MITLCCEPHVDSMSWKDFTSQKMSHSIALDGFVSEGPRFNPRGPWANFNHHEGVSRLETRATCAQILIAVRQGLFDSFKDEVGNSCAYIQVNDCDEDVCLSWFILKEHNLATGIMNPILNRLVFMEDLLDTTGGAYPFPRELFTMQQLMWVFAPYHQFRVSGQLDRRDHQAFWLTIQAVRNRIMDYITGKGETVQLDTRFKRIGGGEGWTMVKEVGTNARIGVFNDGVRAFVAVRELEGGRFAYTLGRSSQFVRFPIPRILHVLNASENVGRGRWGGSDIVAGSPRVNGSALTPNEVTKIIEDIIALATVKK